MKSNKRLVFNILIGTLANCILVALTVALVLHYIKIIELSKNNIIKILIPCILLYVGNVVFFTIKLSKYVSHENTELKEVAREIVSDLKLLTEGQCNRHEALRCSIDESHEQFKSSKRCIFFFPEFKSCFDQLLDMMFNYGVLTVNNVDAVNTGIMESKLKDEMVFIVLAARLIIRNPMLGIMYSKSMLGHIQSLSLLSIEDDKSTQMSKCAAEKIVGLLDKKVYSINSWGRFAEIFHKSFNMCLKEYSDVLVKDYATLCKCEDSNKKNRALAGLFKIASFKYYFVHDFTCGIRDSIELADKIVSEYKQTEAKDTDVISVINGVSRNDVKVKKGFSFTKEYSSVFSGFLKSLKVPNTLIDERSASTKEEISAMITGSSYSANGEKVLSKPKQLDHTAAEKLLTSRSQSSQEKLERNDVLTRGSLSEQQAEEKITSNMQSPPQTEKEVSGIPPESNDFVSGERVLNQPKQLDHTTAEKLLTSRSQSSQEKLERNDVLTRESLSEQQAEEKITSNMQSPPQTEKEVSGIPPESNDSANGERVLDQPQQLDHAAAEKLLTSRSQSSQEKLEHNDVLARESLSEQQAEEKITSSMQSPPQNEKKVSDVAPESNDSANSEKVLNQSKQLTHASTEELSTSKRKSSRKRLKRVSGNVSPIEVLLIKKYQYCAKLTGTSSYDEAKKCKGMLVQQSESVKSMHEVILSNLKRYDGMYGSIYLEKSNKYISQLIRKIKDFANSIQQEVITLSCCDELCIGNFKCLLKQQEKYSVCWQKYILSMTELFKYEEKRYLKGVYHSSEEEELVLREKLKIASDNFHEQSEILDNMQLQLKGTMQSLIDMQSTEVSKLYKSYKRYSMSLLSESSRYIKALKGKFSFYEQLRECMQEGNYIRQMIKKCNNIMFKQEILKERTESKSVSASIVGKAILSVK